MRWSLSVIRLTAGVPILYVACTVQAQHFICQTKQLTSFPLQAAELRAGRIKGGRGKVVVPNELFSDACIKAAFNHYTSFGTARCLGDKAAAARQMSSQQWKRMLEVTGLLESIGGVAGGHAAADIIFARSRSTGATKLRFQVSIRGMTSSRRSKDM